MMIYFVAGIFLILLLGASIVRSAILIIAAVVLGFGLLIYTFHDNISSIPAAVAFFAIVLLALYGVMRMAGYNSDGTKD